MRLLLLLRPRLSAWLQAPGPWKATIAGNAWIMTLFLWHVPAYAVVYALVWATGWRSPQEPTVQWWLERPFWFVAPAALCMAAAGVLVATRRSRPAADDVPV